MKNKTKLEKPKPALTVEQLGVEAIIYLQDMVGITETPEQALKGWNAMSEHEKQSTLDIYNLLKSD